MTELHDVLNYTAQGSYKWSAARNFYQQQLQAIDNQISGMGTEALNLAAAEKVLADTITHCSAETKASIEAFLSLSLQQIFGGSISIELLQEVKRDRVETKIVLHGEEAGEKYSGPPDEVSGGGIQNVISFLLRFLALRRMKLQPIMILDEAFRNVSVDHLPKVCSFLQHLTKEHSLDILAITHDPNLINSANRAYSLAKTNGELTIVSVQEASVPPPTAP